MQEMAGVFQINGNIWSEFGKWVATNSLFL